jgi:hypothetical protein
MVLTNLKLLFYLQWIFGRNMITSLCSMLSTVDFPLLLFWTISLGDRIQELPSNAKPKALKEKYEVDLIGSIPSERFSLIWEDRRGKPVITTLNKAVYKHRDLFPGEDLPDFVVMGHHGRKGPKEVPSTLGSNTDRALRSVGFLPVHPTSNPSPTHTSPSQISSISLFHYQKND